MSSIRGGLRLVFQRFTAATLLMVSFTLVAHPGDEAKLQYLSQQIKRQPVFQQAYIERGALFTAQGQYEKALADFEQAQQLGLASAVGFELGRYFFQRQQYDLAIEQFSVYLAAFGGFLPALEYRAKAYRAQQQYAKALADYQQLLQINPSANPGQYLAAAALAQRVAAESAVGVSDALAIIDVGIEQLGLLASLQYYAIELAVSAGQFEEAIARQQSLAKITGQSPWWHWQMAQLLLTGSSAPENDNSERNQQLRYHLDQIDRMRSDYKNTPALQQVVEQAASLRQSLQP